MILLNILILLLASAGYFYSGYSSIQDADFFQHFMLSALFGLGFFSVLKVIQYSFLHGSTNGKVVKQNSSSVNTGKTQDVGSYSRGYRYDFLVEGENFSMPKYFHFGSKYSLGDKVWLVILSYDEKTALPVRALFNVFIIGVVAMYVSVALIK